MSAPAVHDLAHISVEDRDGVLATLDRPERLSRGVVRSGATASGEEAWRMPAAATAAVPRTEDHQEGPRALVQMRPVRHGR